MKTLPRGSSVHVVYAADDGIDSLRCGVGTMARNFLLAFPTIAEHFMQKGITLRLSVISIKHRSGSVGLRPDFLAYAQNLCKQYNGAVYLIDSQTNPEDDYFQFGIWEDYNAQAREIVDAVTSPADAFTVVITNEAIFGHTFGVTPLTRNVWIPHTLSTVHGQSYVNDAAWSMWEQATFDRTFEDTASYVGYITPYVQELLGEEFRVPPTKLAPFRNGFYLPGLYKSFGCSEEEVSRMLVSRGIPTDKKVLLAFGRADEYKGLDISLSTMAQITREHPDYHGVLIASRFSKEHFIDGLQVRLKAMADSYKGASISLFLGYEFELPKYLLRYHNTKFLFNLPTRDFSPLIPFEAQLLGHEQLCVINSDIPCLRANFRDQEELLCQPTVQAAYQCFENARTNPRLAKIIARGKQRAQEDFDIRQNYINGLEAIIC